MIFLLLVAMILALQELARLQQLHDGRTQHIDVERLRHVCIGTIGDSYNAVGIAAQCCHQHHRDMVGVEVGLQFLAQRHTVHHWHHDIADDDIDLTLMCHDIIPSLLSVGT